MTSRWLSAKAWVLWPRYVAVAAVHGRSEGWGALAQARRRAVAVAAVVAVAVAVLTH